MPSSSAAAATATAPIFAKRSMMLCSPAETARSSQNAGAPLAAYSASRARTLAVVISSPISACSPT